MMCVYFVRIHVCTYEIYTRVYYRGVQKRKKKKLGVFENVIVWGVKRALHRVYTLIVTLVESILSHPFTLK